MLICLLCMLSLCLFAGGPAGAGVYAERDAVSGNSGLVKTPGYGIFEKNTQKIPEYVYRGDEIRLIVSFTMSDGVQYAGAPAAKIDAWGFSHGSTGDVTISGRDVTVVIDSLKYNGTSSPYVTLTITGVRDDTGESVSFSEAWSIDISECYPDSGSGGQDGNDPIPTPEAPDPPRLAVDVSARFPAANAGQSYSFEVPVKNIGRHTARDITVSIDPETPDFPFEYDKFAFTATITELTINAVRGASFKVYIPATVRSGQYPIKINFSARSSLGSNASYTDSSETIVISIKNANTPPKLNLERISLITDSRLSAWPDAGDVDAGGAADSDGTGGARARISAVIPGENFIIVVYISNAGTLAAKDVSLTLTGLRADGVLTNNAPGTQYIKQIDGKGSVSQSFDLISSRDLTGWRAEIGLSITYNDETGKEYSAESQLFIPLVQPDDEEDASKYSGFEFTDITAPSGALGKGAGFSVGFTIVNTGDVAMDDIKLSYSAGPEFIGKSLNTRMLKPIPPGESVRLQYDFSVTNNFSSGNYPIAFTIDYAPGAPETGGTGQGGAGQGGATPGQRIAATQYIGVLLNMPDETTTTETSTTEDERASVPKIIISNFNYEPRQPKAGQTVDITLTFFNTSMSQDVKNIKIQLDSDPESSGGMSASSGVFSPVEGSNSFYIERIEPRGEVDRSITLMIRGDADARSYQLNSIIEYEDSKSNPISTRESISIPVTQVTKVTIGDIYVQSPMVTQYQPFSVSYSFINMGKSTLYNVMATVDGPFSQQAQGYYAGNMGPGSQDYYDASVAPELGGDQIGYALITYEDAQGNLHEERMEFPFFVMEMGDWNDGGMYDGYGDDYGFMDGEYGYEQENSGGFIAFITAFPDNIKSYASAALDYIINNWQISAAVGAGVILLLILLVSLRRRARRKKMDRELNRMMDDELDEDAVRDGDRGGDSDSAPDSAGRASRSADSDDNGRNGSGYRRAGVARSARRNGNRKKYPGRQGGPGRRGGARPDRT